MTVDPRTPVIAGVGIAGGRPADLASAPDAVALMVEAARRAGVDAGAPDLLARTGAVLVPKGFWPEPDPGRIVAEAVGAPAARTVLAEIGVLQTTLLGRAAADVAAGRADAVVVVGGEAKYRDRLASQAGAEPAGARQPELVPDEVLRPAAEIHAPLELERGLVTPVAQYALMEQASRGAGGQAPDAHRREVAALWAGASAAAAANPDAWRRDVVAPDEIERPSADNPMLATPYTRRHTSQWNVDQAGAVLVTSIGAARAAGVPEAQLVFPHAVVDANHMVPVSCRRDPHRSPGFAIAGARLAEHTGRAPGDATHLELYSCFPVAVRVQQRELGVDPARPFTVAGGMAFAGGPLNNYVLQALGPVVRALRAAPGSSALVTAVSGMLTKQGVSWWSTEPPPAPFAALDVTDAVAAATGTVRLDPTGTGAAEVVAATVVHLGGVAAQGVVLCDLAPDRRTLATTTDPGTLASIERDEWRGRRVAVGDGGVLRV